MNEYAVYDEPGVWLYNVKGDSQEEALALAQESDPRAHSAVLVTNGGDAA